MPEYDQGQRTGCFLLSIESHSPAQRATSPTSRWERSGTLGLLRLLLAFLLLALLAFLLAAALPFAALHLALGLVAGSFLFAAALAFATLHLALGLLGGSVTVGGHVRVGERRERKRAGLRRRHGGQRARDGSAQGQLLEVLLVHRFLLA